eukprot:1819843-Prorocentrum_lima.AAC.1
MVKKIIDAFGEPWTCRATGIIPRYGSTIEEYVSTRVFLGMVVELAVKRLVMHQRPYLESKLKKRRLMAPNFGEESLPEPREGHYQQEDK